MSDLDEVAAPPLDPILEQREENEYNQAVNALGEREQSIVANILSGRLKQSGESVLTAGIVTRISRSSDDGVVKKTGANMLPAFNAAGINDAFLATTMLKGLKAMKVVNVKGIIKRIPDYASRIRYLELAHRLRGDLVTERSGEQQADTYEQRIMAIMQRTAKAR